MPCSNKIGTQIHAHRQSARRLRRINGKRHPVLLAQRCHLPDGQDIAEHIGAVGKNRRIGTGPQGIFKPAERVGMVK